MRKHHDNETFRAGDLLERGDGGYRRGDRYPTLSKGSFYDEVFAAAFGRVEGLMKPWSIKRENSPGTQKNTLPTSKKLRGDKVQAHKEDIRRLSELEFSMDNKFILPRDQHRRVHRWHSAVAFISKRDRIKHPYHNKQRVTWNNPKFEKRALTSSRPNSPPS